MDPLFEQIKANCLCDPRLLEKVIVWSRHHDNFISISKEDTRKLSHGRLWITLRFAKSHKDMEQDCLQQDALDNLKGAYQEIEPCVYKQPIIQGSDLGM